MQEIQSPNGSLVCPVCEYNLTGLAENVCPECGEAFDAEQLCREGPRRKLPLGRMVRRMLWTLFILLICVSGTEVMDGRVASRRVRDISATVLIAVAIGAVVVNSLLLARDIVGERRPSRKGSSAAVIVWTLVMIGFHYAVFAAIGWTILLIGMSTGLIHDSF